TSAASPAPTAASAGRRPTRPPPSPRPPGSRCGGRGSLVVPPAMLQKLTRGVNISRWFRYPAIDSEAYYLGFITDADLDLLVAMGVTAVRLAVDPRYL